MESTIKWNDWFSYSTNPIKYKRRLYANILLSGGSSSFLNLDKKIEFCLKNRVDKRLKKYNYDKRKDTNNIKVNISNFSIKKFAEYSSMRNWKKKWKIFLIWY